MKHIDRDLKSIVLYIHWIFNNYEEYLTNRS